MYLIILHFWTFFQNELFNTSGTFVLDTLPLHILQKISLYVIGYSITEISVLRKISDRFNYVIQTIEQELPRIYLNPSVQNDLHRSLKCIQLSNETIIPIKYLCSICGKYSGLMVSIKQLLNKNKRLYMTYKLHLKQYNQFGWYSIINVNTLDCAVP